MKVKKRFISLTNREMLKELLLDILIPKKCLGCRKEGQYICHNCETFLSEAPSKMNEAEPLSVWEYEGIIEKAILKIKYDGCYDIINELVNKAFEKIDLNLPPDVCITYVPMYKKRERQRGFNQAELIAKKVGEKTGRPVMKLLEKTKDAPAQKDLSARARLENVKNAFTPLTGHIGLQAVLLVDDFCATGATIKECMRTLKDAGAKKVYGFTLARDYNV